MEHENKFSVPKEFQITKVLSGVSQLVIIPNFKSNMWSNTDLAKLSITTIHQENQWNLTSAIVLVKEGWVANRECNLKMHTSLKETAV